jgi:hypothetical protein
VRDRADYSLDNHRRIREKLAALKPDLPPLPESEVNPKDEGWLFDSCRGYREQLRHHKDR